MRAIEVLRAQIELHVVAAMLGHQHQGRFELAVYRERVDGARLRAVVVADLVAANVPDGYFGGETVSVAFAVFPLVDVHVTFADCGSRASSLQCVGGSAGAWQGAGR